MEIALFIQNIQEERAEVALYIFTNQSKAATDTQREKNRKVTDFFLKVLLVKILYYKWTKLFSIKI